MPQAEITVLDSHKSPEDNPAAQYAVQSQFIKNPVELVEDEVKVINYSMGAVNEGADKIAWREE